MKILVTLIMLSFVMAACTAVDTTNNGDAAKVLQEAKDTDIENALNSETGSVDRTASATQEAVQVADDSVSSGGSSGSTTGTSGSSNTVVSSDSVVETTTSSGGTAGAIGDGFITRTFNVYDSLSGFGVIDGSDLEFLNPTTARKGSLTSQVSQRVTFTDGIGVHTAATMAIWDNLGITTTDSETFDDRVFIPAGPRSMRYETQIQNTALLNGVSQEEPLFFEFLGRELEITGVGTDSLTAIVGQRVTLNSGETFVINGKNVTLERVSGGYGNASENESLVVDIQGPEHTAVDFTIEALYNDRGSDYDAVEINFTNGTELVNEIYHSGDAVMIGENLITIISVDADYYDSYNPSLAAVITVDGETKLIDLGDEDEINGINIQFVEGYSEEGYVNDWGTFIIGAGTEEQYSHRDAYIGEDLDDPAWTWDLSSLDQGIIAIDFALDLDRPDENDNPRYTHPLYEGDWFDFPENFLAVEFSNLGAVNSRKYEIGTSSEDLMDSTGTYTMFADAKVIMVRAYGTDDEGIIVGSPEGGVSTEAAYLYPVNGIIQVYAKEADGSDAVFVTNVSEGYWMMILQYGSVNNVISLSSWNGLNGTLTFALDQQGIAENYVEALDLEITKNYAGGFTFLGSGNDDIGIENDLVWRFNANALDLSSREADVQLASGAIVEDPELHLSSDELFIHLRDLSPQKATIKVFQEGYVSDPEPKPKPVKEYPEIAMEP